MPREKNIRKLNFKPITKIFGSKDIINQNIITLLHEEIEAIYLMDQLGLYQEDAASKMGVSRPTFSRIIKNARVKIANALISGAQLHIEDEKEDYLIAVCSSNENTIISSHAREKYIHIYEVKNKEIKLLKVIDNPVFMQNGKPAMILPTLFLDENINYYFANEIGQGLKGALQAKGIFTILKNTIEKDNFLNINS